MRHSQITARPTPAHDVVARWNVPDGADAAPSDAVGPFAGHSASLPILDIRARYLSLGDGFRAERHAYIDAVFNIVEHFRFAEHDVSFLSRARSDFDLLVIGGCDTARMAKVMRASRSALNQKVTIALLADSSAHRRAQVLQSGFDEAIDINKVTVAEAAARIRAVWARYKVSLYHDKQIMAERDLIETIAYVDRLTRKEISLIREFLSKKNLSSSYFALRQILSTNHEPGTMISLRTAMCNLRKKLKPGVEIVASHFNGYRLIINQD